MSGFDNLIDDVRKHARHRMKLEILRAEDKASIGGFRVLAKPKFSESDKESLLLNAESEAVHRVFDLLRKAAFPDE